MIIINDPQGKKVAETRGTVIDHDGWFETEDDLGNIAMFPEGYKWKEKRDDYELTDEEVFAYSFLFGCVVIAILIFLVIIL